MPNQFQSLYSVEPPAQNCPLADEEADIISLRSRQSGP